MLARSAHRITASGYTDDRLNQNWRIVCRKKEVWLRIFWTVFFAKSVASTSETLAAIHVSALIVTRRRPKNTNQSQLKFLL
jgi:hypothetical protein